MIKAEERLDATRNALEDFNLWSQNALSSVLRRATSKRSFEPRFWFWFC